MLNFAQKCKNIVSSTYHHQVKAKLTEQQAEKTLLSLIQPSLTCWGSLKACSESLHKIEKIVYSIVFEKYFLSGGNKSKQNGQEVHKTITDIRFLFSLENSNAILDPIDSF